MRSVITVLAAAVMGAASAFGTSAEAVAGASAHRTAEVDAKMSADFAVRLTASVPGAALRPAPPASGTIDLSGQYLLTGMSGGQSAVARSFEIVQEGSEVTLKKFIFPDANDIHGTVATRNLNGTIYDVIQIEPGQVLFTQDE
ncbi:MAG: hypothetical protein K2K36_03295, partial [Muribaculaceae bacterium]|nr:hypothetical protein [Muribaculaceae bacterium]